MRVLVLSDSANPEYSSAALVGWSLTQALAQHVDVHLVTKPDGAAAIARAGWVAGREFTAIDPSRVERPVAAVADGIRKATGLGWTLTTALSTIPNAAFERLVWRRFGADIRARRFDVVHRITPVSPAIPSPIAARCGEVGVPFVLGPINGGVPWPKEFRGAQWGEGEWLSYLRSAYRLVPGYRSTRRSAAGILAGSRYAWDELAAFRDRCVYLPENAIDPARVSAERRAREEGPLRAAFVGRFVPLKGVDMLIEAAAPLIRAGRLTLDLIGDGPERPRLERQIAREGIVAGVSISGWLHDQRKVAPRLARSDVFAFPSIREFGGGAVLEAMALGLAPIVVDYGGPSELVTKNSGFRVPMGRRDDIVIGFRRTLELLAERPELARRVGEGAKERVLRFYTWDVKARQVTEVYRWVLGMGERPHFGMPFPEMVDGESWLPDQVDSVAS
jgi:glycosyltransferase involved in cell wall biosynthesis